MHEEPHVRDPTTRGITGYQKPGAATLNVLPILQTVVRAVDTLVNERNGRLFLALRRDAPEVEFADISDSAERAM
jgi:hypothetical protein